MTRLFEILRVRPQFLALFPCMILGVIILAGSSFAGRAQLGFLVLIGLLVISLIGGVIVGSRDDLSENDNLV